MFYGAFKKSLHGEVTVGHATTNRGERTAVMRSPFAQVSLRRISGSNARMAQAYASGSLCWQATQVAQC